MAKEGACGDFDDVVGGCDHKGKPGVRSVLQVFTLLAWNRRDRIALRMSTGGVSSASVLAAWVTASLRTLTLRRQT